MKNINNKKISVVIATLGGDCLNVTIEKLNSGTVLANEILICIPKEFVKNIANLNYRNVAIIETEFKGQVAQRAIGFQNAKYDFVLQLDDDLLIKEDCLENLLEALKQLPLNSAVAPQYFYKGTTSPFHQKPSNASLLKIYYFLINDHEGFKQGVITKAGTPIGCTFEESDDQFKQCEWLPGGCVLHRKNNLVTHDFFPLKGKAFSEDLFHSMLLKQKGVNFFVVKDAYIGLDKPEDFGFKKNLKNIIADYKARKIFLITFKENKSFLRMYIYYLLNFKRHIFRK